mmetsp:Transcript_4680/g.14834  ORF Transcript_4680/g.14834 Transcript_4680/m.14834 type:complete len:437 (+) Transcript_4680:1307-2617(+)
MKVAGDAATENAFGLFGLAFGGASRVFRGAWDGASSAADGVVEDAKRGAAQARADAVDGFTNGIKGTAKRALDGVVDATLTRPTAALQKAVVDATVGPPIRAAKAFRQSIDDRVNYTLAAPQRTAASLQAGVDSIKTDVAKVRAAAGELGLEARTALQLTLAASKGLPAKALQLRLPAAGAAATDPVKADAPTIPTQAAPTKAAPTVVEPTGFDVERADAPTARFTADSAETFVTRARDAFRETAAKTRASAALAAEATRLEAKEAASEVRELKRLRAAAIAVDEAKKLKAAEALAAKLRTVTLNAEKAASALILSPGSGALMSPQLRKQTADDLACRVDRLKSSRPAAPPPPPPPPRAPAPPTPLPPRNLASNVAWDESKATANAARAAAAAQEALRGATATAAAREERAAALQRRLVESSKKAAEDARAKATAE